MANTISSSLNTDFLIETSITKLQPRLAPLNAFARQFTTDRYKPKATAQCKFVTQGSTTLTNATDFEQTDSTVTNCQIPVAQLTQPFGVSNDELNSGLRMADLIDANAKVFANSIWGTIAANITEANFANYNGGSYVAAPSAFGWSDMGQLWGALKKADEKYAILDGEYIAPLMNSPTFFQMGLKGAQNDSVATYGWNGIHTATDWSTAGSGVRGLACNPNAIGVVAGLPLRPQNAANLLTLEFTLPDLGLSVQLNSWLSLKSRTQFMSFDVVIGSNVLDTSAAVIVKAA